MDRPRIYVDFNERVDADVFLLSKEDVRMDSAGNEVVLEPGLTVHVYMDDADDRGRPDNLLATGVVELNPRQDWSRHVKWCCRIDPSSYRHESDR